MKKTILSILMTAFIITITYGQITTTKVAQPKETIDNTPYDSLDNFVGKNARKYIGQELYLTGLGEGLREYGYDGFVKDYTKDKFSNKSNIYQCCSGYNSKYEALNEKYFKVLDVINHPQAKENELLYGSKYFLKLEEKASKDIVYFEYDSRFAHAFPFIVVGFFEKQKKQLPGQEFVLTNRILKVSTGRGLDITTGKPLTITTGEKWICKDITIEEKYYELALVISNSIGETTTVSYDAVFDDRKFAYTLLQANNYRENFGNENLDKILQAKVTIGMTKEMCRLSWGKPKSINETITSENKTEQWVYADSYLYFENGILTAIQ